MNIPLSMEWHINKEELPEVNVAVEVQLVNGDITWDALQFVNSQYIWTKHQGKIEFWRYFSELDARIARKARNNE